MTNTETRKRVFLYCRKSSEGEDRQMLSIPSQAKELKEMANRTNLEIAEIFEESKSAKAPGRPKFADMMARLYKKEADGVLCWKLDRLARNPVDGGTVIWAVKDQRVEIITPSQVYSSVNDNTLLMYVEFGMAQKFIDDLGKNAKRGMKTKAEMGWYPAPAPIGYLNTPDRKKGFKTILIDPSTAQLVRRAFNEVLRGRQAMDVWREAHEAWHLKGKTGRPISRSGFYYMLNNPFYFGDFEWTAGSGNWYKGKHKPIITHEEFDLTQKMLGKFGKPIAKPHHHIFDLTGLIRCGECGCAITATKKRKYYKGTNRTAYYTYYHCTHRSLVTRCHQKPIGEKEILRQVNEVLTKLQPPQDFIDWAKRWLRIVHQDKSSQQEAVLSSQQNALQQNENKLNKLLDMRLSDELDEQTYNFKKKELEKEKRDLQERLSDTSRTGTNHRQAIETALDFAYAAREKFLRGTRDDKREILFAIGSNLSLENKILRIDLFKHFKVLSDHEKWDENYSGKFEPQKYSDTLSKYPDLVPANPIWLPG